MNRIALKSSRRSHSSQKLFCWGATLALSLNLPLPAQVVEVQPSHATTPVRHPGDASDDPAIWVNRENPAASLIIGTDKLGGLAVYDLSGKELQYLYVGKMNNVDLRTDFPLGQHRVTIVTASNRSDNSLAIYQLNPNGPNYLVDIASTKVKCGFSVYGSCMYRSPNSGKLFAYVTDKADGRIKQFELSDAGNGKVKAIFRRELKIPSGGRHPQVEGCVADDETATLYIGQEALGIWRYGAEPDGADAANPTLVAQIDANSPLKKDLEGLAIARFAKNRKFLIASSQGDDSFICYQMQEGATAFAKKFRIVSNQAGQTAPGALEVDGVSKTDGIEVCTDYLGPLFPYGVFVAQDYKNTAGTGTAKQNFKMVPLQRIFPDLLPRAYDSHVTVREDTPTAIEVTASGWNEDSLVPKILSSPTNGTLDPQTMIYTPKRNFHGQDGFTFAIGDGVSVSSPATVTLTVEQLQDDLPKVSIVSPSPGANYSLGTPVIVYTPAWYADGTITRVELWEGNTLLQSDSTRPFVFTVPNLGVGSHTLTAVAYGSTGAVSSPTFVTVTIR